MNALLILGLLLGQEADVLLKNALIVDGTGAPAFQGDVAIRGDAIAGVGAWAGTAAKTIDATGLVALENTISGALKARKEVILAGPLPKPQQIFDKAKLEKKHVGLHIAKDVDAAVALAERLLADRKTPAAPPEEMEKKP